ncbi:MAG: hypothetical protein ABI242_00085 [Caulobacteraceae bacterium]
MIAAAALVGLLVVAEPPRAVDVGARVAAAQAAQSLQGPLDGGWTLTDAAGAALFTFEIVDPAGGHGPLTGAWRDERGEAKATGLIADPRRRGRRLWFDFVPDGGAVVRLSLEERSAETWSGRMIRNGRSRAVGLRRLAAPRPPV